MPAQGSALANETGAWKAKHSDESLPLHLEAPPSE